MDKNPRLLLIFVSMLLLLFSLSCKKDNENPSPTPKENLTGNGTVKYWQAVSIIEVAPGSGTNLYLTAQPCAVDNYVVFFDNGDYEERSFGLKCFPDERLIVNTLKWELNGSNFKLKGSNGFSIYDITSTLFATDVTITELTSTRFKGYRVKSANDTIKFTLSAVPM